MTIEKHIARPLALTALVGTLALPASAQWGPEEEKNCFLKGKKGTITLSGQINDAQGDSSKLEQYEEIPEGFLVPCAAYSWSNEKYFFDAKAIDIGYDDQYIGGLFGKKGGFLLDVSWDQNPNWQSNTARTPYTETSAGIFSVPDSMRLALQNVYVPWVPPTTSNPVGTGTAPANPTVPGFYAVENYVNLGLPAFDLRYVRKTGRAGFEVPVGKSLVLNASYARETRDGNKNTTFYGGPDYEVATPIDYVTDNFRFGGDFAKGRLFFGASVDFSQFTNEVPFVEIDNPERLEMVNPTNGRAIFNDAEFFRLAMYPDNEAWQADFTGGITLPARHKLTASLSTGNMSMDTALQNISTNPNLQTSATAPNPLFTVVPPYGSVAAEYDTFMGQVRLTGDPIRWLGYIVSWRKFELDDKTQHYHFTSTARGDVGASYSADGFTREHEGWSIESLRGEVHVTPITGLRLGASYGQDKRTYDIREYADVTDDVWTFTGDYTHRLFSLRLKYDILDRKPGDSNEEAIPPSWAGATQTDITERSRHMFSGFLTVTPTEKLAITLNGAKTSNEFAESVTGLLDQSFDMFGIDASLRRERQAERLRRLRLRGLLLRDGGSLHPARRGAAVRPRQPVGQRHRRQGRHVPRRARLDAGAGQVDAERHLRLHEAAQHVDLRLRAARHADRRAQRGERHLPGQRAADPGHDALRVRQLPDGDQDVHDGQDPPRLQRHGEFTASVLYWKQKYDNDDWQTGSPMPPTGDSAAAVHGTRRSRSEPLVLPGRDHPELRRQHLPRLPDVHLLESRTPGGSTHEPPGA